MSEFDDIFTTPNKEPEDVSVPPFDKEEWVQQKKAERVQAFVAVVQGYYGTKGKAPGAGGRKALGETKGTGSGRNGKASEITGGLRVCIQPGI